MYKVNKQKCTGCRVCLQNCPGATKIGADGKAEVINQEKLEQCGGESVCPFGAIEKIEEGEERERKPKQETETGFTPGQGRGLGIGRGRGIGLSRGKGLGRGSRNGRGKGRGGGGRW